MIMKKKRFSRGAENVFSRIRQRARRKEEELRNLESEYCNTLNSLREAENGEEVERFLKNEAYSFILAEGLTDKFLEYRKTSHRSKHQEALYNLTIGAGIGGLWIDIDPDGE